MGAAFLFSQDSTAGIEQQAIGLIQNGQSSEAAKLLQVSVQRYPNAVNLWNLLGIAETESGDLASAKSAFQKGLVLAPRSAELNENMGLLFFRNGDYATAEKYLSAAVKLGSSKPGVRFSLAASKLRTGEAAGAVSELRSLEPELSGSADYWEERGRAELLQNPKSAEESFDRALAISANDVGALNEAAGAAEKQQQDEKALAYLIRARAAAPDDIPTLVHFGAVCLRRDLGLDARDALEKAHQLQPANNAALYLLARANVALQNWQQAYDLFTELSRRAPKFAPAYYALGWLGIRLNRVDDARVQLNRALMLEPSLSGAAYELAQLEFQDGQLDVAERRVRAIPAGDRDPKANLLLADILARKGNVDEAEQLLKTAIAEDGSSAAAHYKLALLLLRKHEPEQADQEKKIAADLTAAATQASKTQMKLALPETESVH
jgi:Flp pilus assembly protein TadD